MTFSKSANESGLQLPWRDMATTSTSVVIFVKALFATCQFSFSSRTVARARYVRKGERKTTRARAIVRSVELTDISDVVPWSFEIVESVGVLGGKGIEVHDDLLQGPLVGIIGDFSVVKTMSGVGMRDIGRDIIGPKVTLLGVA